MYKYLWEAFSDDGRSLPRFALSGAEHVPDPWRTRQFHFFSLIDRTFEPISLYIPKGAYFTYWRRHQGDKTIFVAGWQWPDESSGTYLYLLPDGTTEVAAYKDHQTRLEGSTVSVRRTVA